MNGIFSIYYHLRRKLTRLSASPMVSITRFNGLFLFLCISSYAGFVVAADESFTKVLALEASDYFARPASLASSRQDIVLVNIDHSQAMLKRAYSSFRFDSMGRDGRVGYFKPLSQYRYNVNKHYFEEDLSLKRGQKTAWDGQFLNWLLMRQIDMVRYFLLGVQKANKTDEGVYSHVIDLASSSSKMVLRDSHSQAYSPIPNAMPITIAHGFLHYHDQSFQLRLHNPEPVKGLQALLAHQASLYFYAYKNIQDMGLEKQMFFFGDASEVKEYLASWTVDETERPKSLGQQAALQQALEKIKRISLNKQAKSPQLAECQRYVHLILSASLVLSSQLSHAQLLSDCQHDIEGNQPLTHFQLLTSDEVNLSQDNSFMFDDIEKIMKSIFKVLSAEDVDAAFILTGAASESYPDNTGVLYQSMFKYALQDTTREINWLGDLKATLIDKEGYLRSDNGNKKLDALAIDPILSSCFDDQDRVLRFRFLTKPSPEERCHVLNYPYLDKDVGYLWQASDVLNKANHMSFHRQRQPFQSSDHRRYIRTHLGQKEYDFVEHGNDSGSFPVKPERLNLQSQQQVDKLINYIRGQDQEHFRSRHLEQAAYLLGDMSHAAPIIVSQPSSNYHLLYADQSYQKFFEQYQNRRSRVFVGANDGMLHSFNAGWFDVKNHQLKNAPENGAAWRLGQEVWAFIPSFVLPYLSELKDNYYGLSPQHHLNFFSQAPYVFDAQVFGEHGLKGQADRLFTAESGHQRRHQTHPEGWGTLMVVGGGLDHAAYLVFDITDAEQAPKLLAELKGKNLGGATSLPSVMTLKNQQGMTEWYLALGSGKTHDLVSDEVLNDKPPSGVFLFNLNQLQSGNLQSTTTQGQSDFIDLNETGAYVTGITSVDWNLDGESDAMYVNTASDNKNAGAIYRINVRKDLSKKVVLQVEKLLDTQAPTIARPQVGLDKNNNRWIYLATGQNLLVEPLNADSLESMTAHKIVGLKEPRNTQGGFLLETNQGRTGPGTLDSFIDVSAITVNSATGDITGAWQLEPQLKEQTVFALEDRLMQFSKASDYLDGWVHFLEKGQAATGPSTLFSGTLTQLSYLITHHECRPIVQSVSHRLRFTTGTSWPSMSHQEGKAQRPAAELINTKGFPVSAITSLLLHEGGEGIQHIQTSVNGQTQTTLQDNITDLQSGELSWREL